MSGRPGTRTSETMDRPTVFVSYSRRDRQWAERLLAHLSVLSAELDVDVWDDERIAAGSSWTNEIDSALSRARAAVLLVSSDYLASKYVADFEIPRIRERSGSGGLAVLPLIVRPSAWQRVPWLQQVQVFPERGTPLSSLPEETVDRELASFCRAVREAVGASGGAEDDPRRAEPRSDDATRSSQRPLVFISHAREDGDFAELAKRFLEENGFDAWIDIDRLDAGYEWQQQIDDAIRRSVAVVVVVSPRSTGSEYVTYEWGFAIGARVLVVPVVIELTKLHARLARLTYLDFTNRRARPWDALLRAIRREAGGAHRRSQRFQALDDPAPGL